MGVVRIPSRFTLSNLNASVGVPSRHFERKADIYDLVPKGSAIGGVRSRCRAHVSNVYPVEVEYGLEYGGLGVFLGPIVDEKPQGIRGGCL